MMRKPKAVGPHEIAKKNPKPKFTIPTLRPYLQFWINSDIGILKSKIDLSIRLELEGLHRVQVSICAQSIYFKWHSNYTLHIWQLNTTCKSLAWSGFWWNFLWSSLWTIELTLALFFFHSKPSIDIDHVGVCACFCVVRFDRSPHQGPMSIIDKRGCDWILRLAFRGLPPPACLCLRVV